ncbi:hypothetical protein ILYODFUR_026450 [Ilyodon furcidens]|uniref:Uncharacterized protein n=1 Tax=Ilyodon furcidens TaxID=33524 RepID=A0ABV0U8Z9_9TELE
MCSVFSDGAGVFRCAGWTGVTYSTDYFEEYLSRRQPALRRRSVLASVIETLNFGFTSLSTDYVSRSFWTTKIIYVLRTLFPISCIRLDSHQAGSFLLPSSPGPSRKRTLSTLQRKHLRTKLIPVCSKLTLNSN